MWEPYVTSSATPIAGTLLRHGAGGRPLLAWLPPSYDRSPDARYPVLLAHDGDNLFDEATSHAGEWCVDETMTALAAEGLEAIVVGVPHSPEARADEYAPWRHPEYGGGGADAYLDELVGVVLPLVRRSFRTDERQATTGILGSSLGGLVSLYGLFRKPATFGFAGVMSPAFWFSGEPIFDFVADAPFVDARIWLDVGGRESPEQPGRSRRYVEDAERMVALLRRKGYDESRLRWTLVEDAPHHETAWARRLPDAMRFFLA